MSTSNQRIGNHKITGDPKVDWSHAASYLADRYSDSLYSTGDPEDNAPTLDQEFRNRLLEAGGIDGLSQDDLGLIEDLDVDVSGLPGGPNYRVSTVSSANPLGLPGELWAAVTEADEGALVAALIAAAGDGELDIMVPGGRGWEPLHDLGVIEGYTLVGASSDAVELFHKYDRDNTLGVISSYPLSPSGPFPSPEQLAVPMPREIAPRRGEADEFWKNSGETYGGADESSDIPGDAALMASAVVIESADDLDDAITAATADPDLRWYVERRVAALGLEASLPWLEA